MMKKAKCWAQGMVSCIAAIAVSCQPSRNAPDGEPGVEPSAAAAPSETKDLSYFLRRLVDLDLLPRPEEGVRTAQFSSYDRKSRLDPASGKPLEWDSNGDAGQYLRVEPDGEAVMAEVEGPGVIWRIWSANPQGRIRFYFDGAEAPGLEINFNNLFSGEIPPFLKPYVWQRRLETGGTNPASDSYLPIPFAKSCKVTADKAHDQYYHIGYSTFPPGTPVKTFSPDLTAEEIKALEEVAGALARPGQDPRPLAGLKTFEARATIPPGEEKVIAELAGPATIRQLRAKVLTPERWGRRMVLLSIYWDGEKTPSVQAPMGDFFGDAWDEAEYRSLPLGIEEPLDYCYFRMPFDRSARVVLRNHGRTPAEVRLEITSQPGGLPPGTARFHARWRRDRESRDFDYPILECAGRGRFVGVALFPHNIVGGWWGEGDEKAYVDGEKFPSTFGTGSEDYFGDAWGIRRFANPFHGCPTREVVPRQSCYRWHIADAIPFSRSFRFTIENYSALEKEPDRNDYSSVAYWYQEPGGKDSFPPAPPEGYAPQPRIVRGAIEAESLVDAAALPAGTAVVSDEGRKDELSGGKGLKVPGAPGTRMPLDLSALEDGRFTIEPVAAPGPGAVRIEVWKDGKPAGDQVLMAKGKNRIEVGPAAGGGPAEGREVVLDYLLLHPYRNFVRRWYLIGPFDDANGQGFDRAYGPEETPFRSDQAFPALGGEARWQRIEAPGGRVLSEGGHFRQNDDIVLYAACEVESPEAAKAVALVGSDDGVKLWVNGKLVHSNKVQRPLLPDQDRVEIDLVKGRNRILLKVNQGGGPWGFTLRIEDPEEKLKAGLPE